MRTVFVPYVLLPETEGTLAELDHAENERERREAGSADRTVVLCVEIENSGELGIGVGVVVEKVDVKIGGEMRRRRLLAGETVGVVRMRQRKRSLRGLDLWHSIICSMPFRSCDLRS